MPALDILKMEENEGLQNLDRDISLLFAASGDCRNVVRTIVNLPEGYAGQCTAVLNDRDFAVVARNVIILLSALHYEPGIGAAIMIHLWYSALIPAIMLETLQEEILPYIEDVCTKIKDKQAQSLQAKTFILPRGSLRLILKKEQWLQLISFFKVPEELSREKALVLRRQTSLNPDRVDYLDRAFLFFFLRDQFLKFYNRFHDTRILFQLYNMDAKELPEYLSQAVKKFDRIEIANICDRGYIGIERTLSTFTPLLRPKDQNPKATLLMLFLNATEEKEHELLLEYQKNDMPRRMKRLQDLIGLDEDILTRIMMGDRNTVQYDPEFLRRTNLHAMFADFDRLFDLYLKDVRMSELTKKNRVKMKKQHSIVEKWPYRVTKSTSVREFKLMDTLSLSGCERYVEIERESRVEVD
ncbi:hypothetical protein ACEQ8H_002412 [Pleosporales sp. CAS-2024a]